MDDIIECPKHNGRFNYKTGEAKGAPVCINLKTFPVRIEGWQSLHPAGLIEWPRDRRRAAPAHNAAIAAPIGVKPKHVEGDLPRPSVYDLLRQKGYRKFLEMHVDNELEAEAAQEAGN